MKVYNLILEKYANLCSDELSSGKYPEIIKYLEERKITKKEIIFFKIEAHFTIHRIITQNDGWVVGCISSSVSSFLLPSLIWEYSFWTYRYNLWSKTKPWLRLPFFGEIRNSDFLPIIKIT